MSEQKYRVAVVIAAYNEASAIRHVVESVPKSIPLAKELTVVVVDDGSVDATSYEAYEAGAVVVRHPINRGQGAALRTGFEWVIQESYDIVVTYDADGQHQPNEINDMVTAVSQKGVDIALGSRFLGSTINMPRSRRFVLKVGVLFTRMLSRVKVTDSHNGFRAINVDALRRMHLVQDRMEHASEIIDQIHKQGLHYVEVPVTIAYTNHSMAKGQVNSAAFKIAGKMIVDKLIH